MSEEVKRMHYFDGLFLKEDEFNLEQDYHSRMRRLHNRYLHSWGIVWGLMINPGPGPAEITVKEGMALNKALVGGEEVSQEIVLTSDTPVNLSAYSPGDVVYVYIYYYEELADVVEAKGGTEKIHWRETGIIAHGKDKPVKENENLILATVTIKADGTIDSGSIKYVDDLGNSLRTNAGFSGEALATKKLTLNIEGVTSKLANIEGKIIDSKNGIQMNSERTNITGSLIVGGDLTVNGSTTTIDTKQLVVEDNIIRVNKYEPPSATPQNINGGLEVYRGGTAPNAQVIWDEGVDKWKIGVEGGLVDVAYGPNWDTLTNNSVANTLHRHSKLVSGNGTTDPALSVDNAGNVGIATTAALTEKLEVNGYVKATGFKGDGSGITNLNGSQVTTGTVADARVATTITRESRFDPTTGHKHTGIAGDGPKVSHGNLENIVGANTASIDTTATKHVSDAMSKGWQDHTVNTSNPHSTTAAQVGALPLSGGTINGSLAVTGTVDGRDVSADGIKLDNHVASTSNPHATTAAQVGALPIAGGTLTGSLIMSNRLDVRASLGTGWPAAWIWHGHPNASWGILSRITPDLTSSPGANYAAVAGVSNLANVNGVYAYAPAGTYALYVSGTAYFSGAKTGYVADIFVNASGQRLRTGDVVKLKGSPVSRFRGENNKIPVTEITLADREDDNMVIGIVDSEAIPEPGSPDNRVGPDDPTFIEDGGELFVITLGAYAHCKVDASEAPIEVGDLLTSSSNQGHAKKAINPKTGSIIGKALEPLKEGTGYIAVFVNIQ